MSAMNTSLPATVTLREVGPRDGLQSEAPVAIEDRVRLIRALIDAAAGLLRAELLNFRVKITAAANETFGAWREGEHDDLVLAVALACWAGEHVKRPFFRVYFLTSGDDDD